MRSESHDARLAQKYLDRVCAWLDAGHPLSEARQAAKTMAVAPVVLLAAGLACSGTVERVPSEGDGGAQGTDEICDNNADDDDNGLVDCEDPACEESDLCGSAVGGSGGAYAAPWENCSNGVDDDYDGMIDCADPDCTCGSAGSGGAYAAPFENCTNGVDDDYDGMVDCADSDCAGSPGCGSAGSGGAYAAPFENCTNGIDDDYDELMDCADPDCEGHPACPADEDCSNGIDDDKDGYTDCIDSDCFYDPECMGSAGAYSAPFG